MLLSPCLPHPIKAVPQLLFSEQVHGGAVFLKTHHNQGIITRHANESQEDGVYSTPSLKFLFISKTEIYIFAAICFQGRNFDLDNRWVSELRPSSEALKEFRYLKFF